jgi:Reverse transcriptase (RNA-dependent DNA polymerase).
MYLDAKVPIDELQVVDIPEEIMLIGTDWMFKYQAEISLSKKTLAFMAQGRRIETSITTETTTLPYRMAGQYNRKPNEAESFSLGVIEYSYNDIRNPPNTPAYKVERADLALRDWPVHQELDDEAETFNMIPDIQLPPENERDPEVEAIYQQFLKEFSDIISKGATDIGNTDLVEFKVETTHQVPVTVQYERRSPQDNVWIKEQCDKLEAAGVIRKSKSNYAAPIVVVGKKDGDKRMTVDFGALNNITPKYEFPMPHADTVSDLFYECQYWTALDLSNAFYQIKVEEGSRHKLAFFANGVLYEFLVMPFGIKNAPATFQYLMYIVLGEYYNKFVFVYLDDIIIYSKTLEEHQQHVQIVLEALRNAHLKISPASVNGSKQSCDI